MKGNIYNFIFYIIFYITTIIGPVIFYIKYREKEKILEYLRLKENLMKGIIIGSSISIIFIILSIIKHLILDTNHLSVEFGVLWIYGLLSGFMEEIPIRGFLLKKVSTNIGFWKANITTSIVFLMLHFPKWIYLGEISFKNIIINFFMSVIFGYLVEEYDSLWASIICHSTLNVAIYIGL